MTRDLLGAHNPLIKSVRRAASRGSLTEDGFAIAEGFHLLEEALASKCEIGAVIVAESAKSIKTVDFVTVSDKTFDQIAATETSQGVIALVRPHQWTIEDLFRGCALVVILDGIQDPGNAGAIVRAAEAFGATGVAFLPGTACPSNPKTLRASAGSLFRLPIAQTNDEILDRKRLKIYAASPQASLQVNCANFAEPCAIIIGAEGRGVSPHLLDRATPIRIPTSNVESLNAAVAAGVILYEARRQRSA